MTSPASDQSSAPHGDPAFGGFDAQEMVVVHRALRREIRLLEELIAAVAPGDVKRSAVLASHFADIRTGLTNHHQGEDELLWPPMLTRVGPERDIILRMETEHEQVFETLTAAAALVTQWAPTADAETRDRVVAALEEHRIVLFEHLDDEETHLLPLAERFLTAKEWAKLGDHFVLSTPKLKLLKFFGIVMEDADEREQATLLNGMPAPARLVWRLLGVPLYARTLRRVRATA
jgi:hemerythrin-like domain-containing protein